MKVIPWIFVTGAVVCFFAVLFGAFGAHAFDGLLTKFDHLDTYETANKYHFFHGFVLLLLGIVDVPKHLHLTSNFIAWCLIIGIVIFSGSLYLLSLTDISFLGAITPIGGLMFLIAWAGMARIGLQWNNT